MTLTLLRTRSWHKKYMAAGMPRPRLDSVALFCLLLSSLINFWTRAAENDAVGEKNPPPLGRLIDIGGWRLHLREEGTSVKTGPTVVLEAGIGSFSFDWALVQTRVAAFARVCSYDRAGYAWSDLGPSPHTMRQAVYEL